MLHSSLRWVMWSLKLSVFYILFYSHDKGCSSKGWLGAKTYAIQLFLTLSIHIILIFSFYQEPTPHLTHTAPYLCTVLCWLFLLKCKMARVQWVLYACPCMMQLCVCVLASFAQFSPAGPEAVFKAAFLASVLRDIGTVGSEKRSLWLKRNETDPLPDSLSWGATIH